ncbi:MAG TPA: phosphoglycolate phosphatase [Spongiibacteraceae bacterium]|nr:phosphoglycolate phosphatase [Spongiibacteraceae bacterium]
MILKELHGGTAPAALLFDLDGTLLDSLPDLATAIDRMLVELGHAAVGAERVHGWIGDGARQLVYESLLFAQGEAASNRPDDATVARALGIYMRHYTACCTDRSRLFDGVRAALAHWYERGVAMACVTNKSARFTEPLLKHFALQEWLPVAVSGDTLAQRKPAAAPLLFACEQLGVDPRNALMVGDSRNDVLAARAAGMPVVCVSYGYNHGRSIAAEVPDGIVDSLLELL